MRYDIRWQDECAEDLIEIYGDLKIADLATGGAVWSLARAPLHRATWALSPGSDYRLTWVKPFMTFPAVVLSYTVEVERINQFCLMHRARRANVSGLS